MLHVSPCQVGVRLKVLSSQHFHHDHNNYPPAMMMVMMAMMITCNVRAMIAAAMGALALVPVCFVVHLGNIWVTTIIIITIIINRNLHTRTGWDCQVETSPLIRNSRASQTRTEWDCRVVTRPAKIILPPAKIIFPPAKMIFPRALPKYFSTCPNNFPPPKKKKF